MPYSGVPDDKVEELDSCVEKVMAEGHDKDAAIAICHESIMGKEAQPSLTVFKQADGSYRWLIVSSNAYRDHDGEIVSQKALEADAARMDATGDYGPLRWWHVPGLDLGPCDFSVLHGRLRVESGTFATAEIGAGVASHAKELQASLGFTHTDKEPDADGVYHHIRVFERSLLPKGRAANPFTFVSVSKDKELTDMASLKEKWGQFVETVFGGDEAKAKAFAANTESTQKAIEQAGVQFKEKGVKAEGEDEEDKPESEMPEGMPEGEPPKEDDEEEEEDKGKSKEAKPDAPVLVSNLTAEEFTTLIAGVVTKETGAQATAQAAKTKELTDAIAALTARIEALEGGTSKAFRASKEGKPPLTVKQPGESAQEKALKEGADSFVSWAVGGSPK